MIYSTAFPVLGLTIAYVGLSSRVVGLKYCLFVFCGGGGALVGYRVPIVSPKTYNGFS